MPTNLKKSFGRSVRYALSALIGCVVAMAMPASAQLVKQKVVANNQTVRIQSYPGNVAAYITWWVARDKGFCKQHGLNCEFVPLASAPLGIQALISNNIQFAGGPTEVAIGAASRGADIQLIASTHPNLYFSLNVRSDLPTPNLSKGYPEAMRDLKGLKVGVTARGTATEMQTKALLQGAGLNPEDVTFVAVGSPGTAYPTLVAKQIDAAMMFQPFKTICEIQKTCVTVADLSKGQGPKELLALNGGFQYVAATRKFIEENPVVVEAMIQALEESAIWLKNPANFEEVVKVMRNNFALSKDIPNPDETLRALAQSEIKSAGVALDRNAVKATVDYMLKYKLLDKPFDTKKLVYEKAPAPQ